MVQKISVEGSEALFEALSQQKGKKVFVLCTSSLGADGKSWCPDCVKADPIIEEGLKSAPEDAVFIQCSVGDIPFWKDQKNTFRTHPELHLKSIPTLIKYGTNQRLQESECSKLDLVQMLFEED